jgi:hypothetical protein
MVLDRMMFSYYRKVVTVWEPEKPRPVNRKLKVTDY